MYPYLIGKWFPFAMGNVSPSHWEKFPPFTFKCFPFLLVNVSFPIGKCFPSHWEEFFLLTGKDFFPLPVGKLGHISISCREMFLLSKGESLIFPVGNVCTSSQWEILHLPYLLQYKCFSFQVRKHLNKAESFCLRHVFCSKCNSRQKVFIAWGPHGVRMGSTARES